LTDSGVDIGEQLVGWGKVGLLETRGRATGRSVRTAVGFARQPDGSLVIASGGPEVDWARNLIAHPSCRMTIGAQTADYVATELAEDEHAQAVVALILKYGTPAERLGRGPAFRLQPAAEGNG
jgi:deazaflavin-dependent oxidoreductase (nitroreductase family)